MKAGDTITWTIIAADDVVMAEIALPTIVFNDDELKKNLHLVIRPGDEPLKRTVSPLAPPGSYPYCIELYRLDEDNEFIALDKFVLGESHTRIHIDPM